MDEWVGKSDLDQGSPAWRAARKNRIGSSDIPVIMRASPYKTRRELWEERTGRREVPDISRMRHVIRGVLAEPVARALIEKRRGLTYTTPVLFHPVHGWAVASLDGLCADHVLEIKTMSLEKHLDVREGIVPDYYVMQCQWQLLISGRQRALFASYRPEDETLYETWIIGNIEQQAEMLDAAIEFRGWVERGEEPPDEFIYMGE